MGFQKLWLGKVTTRFLSFLLSFFSPSPTRQRLLQEFNFSGKIFVTNLWSLEIFLPLDNLIVRTPPPWGFYQDGEIGYWKKVTVKKPVLCMLEQLSTIIRGVERTDQENDYDDGKIPHCWTSTSVEVAHTSASRLCHPARASFVWFFLVRLPPSQHLRNNPRDWSILGVWRGGHPTKKTPWGGYWDSLLETAPEVVTVPKIGEQQWAQ